MPSAPHPLMRPDDADTYRQALRRLNGNLGMPLVFAGQITDGSLVLEQFIGTHTDSMRNLTVTPGRGIGGYVVTHRQTCTLNDYSASAAITHDYDGPVHNEGIRAIAAAPVTVRGTVRGVLYAAVRSTHPIGDRVGAALTDTSRRLAGELTIRDEVDQRLQLMENSVSLPTRQPGAEDDTPSIDDLRDLHAELRSIAGEIEDTALRDRMRNACDRFLSTDTAGESADTPPPSLSPREIDVLTYIALGCSNAEVARILSVLPETVKAYLRSASSKLGAHGRNRAVLAARRFGLLP